MTLTQIRDEWAWIADLFNALPSGLRVVFVLASAFFIAAYFAGAEDEQSARLSAYSQRQRKADKRITELEEQVQLLHDKIDLKERERKEAHEQ
jgi:hypothetical protein